MAEQDNPFLAAPRAGGDPPNNPFLAAPTTSAARELAESDPFLARTSERVAKAVDNATDISKGVLSGGVSVVEGLATLPTIAFDTVFDTNSTRAVTDFFAPIQDTIGPQGTAGRVTADLTAFGAGFIPLAGWLSRASQASRLAKAGQTTQRTIAGKGPLSSFMRSADTFGRSSTGQRLLSTRFGQYGTTALATGAYSALISPDGRATLSDSFDVFPNVLKTEADTGLRGRDEAMRLVRNRGRHFAEDALLSGVFDTTLGAIGAGTRSLAQVPQVAAAANAFNEGLTQAGATLTRRFPKSVAFAKEYFTPSGGANRLLYEEAEDAKAAIRLGQQQATQSSRDYLSAFEELVKTADLASKNRFQNRQFQGEVTRYLEGVSDTLPSVTDPALRKKLTTSLDKMIETSNNHIDRLMFQMESIAKNPALEGEVKQRLAQEAFEVLKQTRNAQGTHLRRVFEQYTNPVRFYKNLDLSTPLAKEAQQEIAQNIAAAEGRNAAEEAVQERAKAVLLRTLGLGDSVATKGMSETQLIKQALEAAKAANKGTGRLGSVFTKESPAFTADKSLFTAQEDIVSKSPKLRELMGEVTDPVERFVRTIEDVTRTAVAEDFYTGLSRLGLERPLSDAVAEINAGGRPAVVSVPDLRSMTDEEYATAMLPFAREAAQVNADQARLAPGLGVGARPSVDRYTKESIVEAYEQQLRNAGYIRLGEADAMDVFGGLYGSASGKYVSPETYRAITQPLRLSEGVLGEVFGILSGFRNFAQKMTIVPSPQTQIRNIIGNVGFLAGNANLPTGGNVTDLLYTFVASMKELDDAGLERLARKLTISGAAETNLVLQALKTYKNAADDLTFAGRLNKAFDLAEGSLPVVGKAMKGFEALYSNSDTFFKGAALLAEEGKVANALARVPGLSEFNPAFIDALIDNGLLTRASSQVARELSPLELMAAEVVKDTMPVFPRVVKAVRSLDAFPLVGTFTSFASEVIRNSAGTVMRGVREAAFEAGPALRQSIGDAAADILEREIRALGLQRLLGYATVAHVLPKSLVRMSMQATGTTPEEMTALYEMSADYLDGHDLVILQNRLAEDGTISYTDLSYVFPYAFASDAAQAAIREYQEKGRADQGTVSSAIQGIWRGFQVFADPFASETLFYERLRNVMPEELLFGRGGKTATGAEIYGPAQSMPDKIGASINHVLAGLTPTIGGLITEERSGDIRQGRLLRAITGTPDRAGRVADPAQEVARLVTGFTPMLMDVRNDAQFKGAEYLPLRTDARSRALRGLKDAAATPQSVVSRLGSIS
jgi:hypothetical protein